MEFKDYKKVKSKEEFLKLINDILNENDSQNWENKSSDSFLQALVDWLESSENFYSNFNLETDSNKPSWQLFADALQAARYYE